MEEGSRYLSGDEKEISDVSVGVVGVGCWVVVSAERVVNAAISS